MLCAVAEQCGSSPVAFECLVKVRSDIWLVWSVLSSKVSNSRALKDVLVVEVVRSVFDVESDNSKSCCLTVDCRDLDCKTLRSVDLIYFLFRERLALRKVKV
jgi:hypothetical protein